MRPRYLPSPPAGIAISRVRKPSTLQRVGRSLVELLAFLLESNCR